MGRAQEPASPAQEAVASGSRLAEGCALDAELAEFLQSGVSIILAAVGPDRRPVTGLGLACTVSELGLTRVILRGEANAGLIAALEAGSGIAVTFSRPITHRSIQIKAVSARIVPYRPNDASTMERQVATFQSELVEVDHTEAFARLFTAYRPDELVAIEFLPDRAFVQTPGPGAGVKLAG